MRDTSAEVPNTRKPINRHYRLLCTINQATLGMIMVNVSFGGCLEVIRKQQHGDQRRRGVAPLGRHSVIRRCPDIVPKLYS
jgi:hypothetical protein